MEILEIRNELVIARVNGNLTTRPNSPYYTLKYTTYENKQIAYTFSDTDYIRETLDDRIFNCWCDGKRLQLRQDLSNQLAVCIQCDELNGTSAYKELFMKAYNERPDYQMLNQYLTHYDDVKLIKNEGFIIHGTFKIDLKGNAYQLNHEDKTWQSLCIVMQQAGHSSAEQGCELPDKYGVVVEINALTMAILSKVLFLREPNMKDTEFSHQLSNKAKLILNRLGGGEVS